VWLRTVLKAHGMKPHWTARLKHKGLSRESKDEYRKINLRWHDLRHEYASRLVERGVPLAQLRDLLGHASISNPDNVVQRTVNGGSSALGRAFSRRFSRHHLSRLRSVSAAFLCRVSHCVSPRGTRDGVAPRSHSLLSSASPTSGLISGSPVTSVPATAGRDAQSPI
jgi:integrase-like protein